MKVNNLTGSNLFNIPHLDKVIHFGLYAVLLSFWMIDFYKKESQFVKSINTLIILGSIIFGGLMEIIQKVIVQERSGDFLDFFANTAGILFAFLLFRYFILYRKLMLRVFS